MHWSRRHVCLGLAALPAMSSVGQTVSPVVARARVLAARSDQALLALLPEGSEANVRPVARRFEALTGARVTLTTTPVSDINTDLLIRHGLGQPVDLALPASYGLPDLVSAGALRPLDELVPQWSSSTSQASLYALGDVVEGRVYGLQTDGDVYVMFYHRGLLEAPEFVAAFAAQHGVEPTPARTFSELDRLLRFFHKPSAGRYGGALFRAPGYLAWEYWMRLHALGRWPFDEQMRAQLTSPEGVRALVDLVDASRFLHPAAATANLTDNWRVFAEGQTLCNIGWGGSQKYFRQHSKALRGQIIVARTPGAAVGHGAVDFGFFNWGWNYAVPRTSRRPELAALFACFAVQPDVSALAVRQADGFFDPFHDAHFRDEGIASVYGKDFLSVQNSSLRSAMPDLYLPGRSRYIDTLDEYIHRVDRGQLRPREALQSVTNAWESHTDELGRAAQARAWAALRRKYPRSLRELLR